MKASKILILLRHAHRNVEDHREDNGLSEKGLRQALALQSSLGERLQKLGQPIELISSPKKRCVETISALSQLLSVPVKIEEGLIERQKDEDSKAFETRIRLVGELLAQKENIVVACSHGDILPELIHHFTDLSTDLGKSGWAELQDSKDGWVLESLVRSVEDYSKT
jgi:8-oxo-dGTP diphosphatase